jgi:hypothetical protein
MQRFKNSVSGELVDFFDCQGEFSESVQKIKLKDPEAKVWARRRDTSLGRPDKEDLNRAKVWAKEIVKKL